MKYSVYTDGSCSPNPGPGGWAAWIQELDKMVSGPIAYGTNNEMEMLAILNALAEIPDGSDVLIFSDSKLAIGWLCFNWKTNGNKRIGDIRASIMLLKDAKRLNVNFRKIKGHSGDPNNAKVDKEARKQARLAADLPRTDNLGHTFVRLTLDVYGVDLEDLLRGINLCGGQTFGLAELMKLDQDGELKILKTENLS